MRRVLPLLLLLLPGCSLPGAEFFGLSTPLPEAEVEVVPAAAQSQAGGEPALWLRWGRRQAVAVLVQQNGENRLWRSPGGMVVATDGARVMATAGPRDWLAATRLDGPDPLDEPLALVGHEATLFRQVDLMRSDRTPASMRFGIGLNCRLRAAPAVGVGGVPVLLVQERCRGGGESFVNRFWADPETGGIYRSEQWIGPAGPLLLEVVNPPAS